MFPPYDPNQQPPPMPGQGSDPNAPPIPMPDPSKLDYTVKLSDTAKRLLCQRLVSELDAFESKINLRRANAREWYRDAELMPADQEDEAWDGSSLLRAPFTRLAVQQHATKLNQQLVRPDPAFIPDPLEEMTWEELRVAEAVMKDKLREAEWSTIARTAHKAFPQDGNVACRVTYEQQTIRVPKQRIETDDEKMMALAEAGVPLHEALLAATETDAQDVPKLKIVWEEKVLWDGPKLKLIPLRDLIFFPAVAQEENDLWGVGEYLTLRGSELDAGGKSGRYDKDAVRDLLKQPSDAPRAERSDYLDAIGVTPGASGGASEDNDLHKSFNLCQVAILDDLDDDGSLEWYLVTLHKPTTSLLQWQYSPYEHGCCPYVFGAYIGRPGELLGCGVAEANAVIQDAATMAINRFFNLTAWLEAAGTTIFYTDSSGFEPSRASLFPGASNRVDNLNEVKFFEVPGDIPACLSELLNALALLKEWSDLIAVTSNPGLGRETAGQKTLGEIQLVLSNASQIFGDYAEGVGLFWSKVVALVQSLLVQFAPNGKIDFRMNATASGAEGEDPTAKVPQTDEMGGMQLQDQPAPSGVAFASVPSGVLEKKIRWLPAGVSAFSDAQARAAQAQAALTLLSQHPLTANDPEIQAELIDRFLSALDLPGDDELIAKVKRRATMLIQAQQMQAQQQMQMEQQMAAQQAQDGQMSAAQQQQKMQGEALNQASQAQQMQLAANTALTQAGQQAGLTDTFSVKATPPKMNGKSG